MRRTYLEEDLELIRSYFPGARRSTLRTPFDLSEPTIQPGTPKTAAGRAFFQDTTNLLRDWGRGGASWTF